MKPSVAPVVFLLTWLNLDAVLPIAEPHVMSCRVNNMQANITFTLIVSVVLSLLRNCGLNLQLTLSRSAKLQHKQQENSSL